MKDYPEEKQELINTCLFQIEDKITTNKKILARLQESLTGETKSSAGDKFETSRAMLQADIARHQELVMKAEQEKAKLNTLSYDTAEEVREGSVVITDKANFFLSIALGKVKTDQLYYVLSIASPLGQQLKGKREGDTFSMNKTAYRIDKIL